jgi:hypothetical protein
MYSAAKSLAITSIIGVIAKKPPTILLMRFSIVIFVLLYK